LVKIAQRAKVKLSIDDYLKRTKQKTKAGGDMSRMAHMELALKHKLNVNLGDVIYYVNNGKKASDGDVQKVTKKLTKKQTEEYVKTHGKNPPPPISEIQINCYMIDSKTVEESPELTGDYNIQRAISTFNKRIEPLLVVFKQDIRDSLLIDNPEDRSFYTKEQSELINGIPFEDGDQDRLKEDVLDMESGEVSFWNSMGISPNYIYDLAEPGWESLIE
jgi:hypothetical protein